MASNRTSSFLLVLAFAAVAAFGLFHHEMWRDEYQAWLVARDADSIQGLFGNLTYEGNPALWHLLLFGLTRFTSNPMAMQVLNYLLAVAAVSVIAFRAPFPFWWRVLLVFGYNCLFEYTLISRSYALGFLLIAIACAWYRTRSTHPIRLAVVLALLAYTHVFGLAIAGAIGLVACADMLVARPGAPRVSGTARAAFLAILIAASAASFAQIYPEADNSFPTKGPESGFDIHRFGESVADVSRSYLPIPATGFPHFWNTNVMDFLHPPIPGWTPTRFQALIALGLFAIFVWVLLDQPLVAAAFVTGTVALVVVKYATGLGLQRYIGHLFVMLVAAMWMSRASMQERPFHSRWREVVGQTTFTLLLLAGCTGGLMAWSADVRYPFSSSSAVVQFLRAERLDQDEIIAIADHAASPVAAELNRKIYFPQLGRDGSFTVWTGVRRETLEPAELLEPIAMVVERSSRHRAVLILNIPAVDVLSTILTAEPNGGVALGGGLAIRSLLHTQSPIVIGEEYFLYLVERQK